MFHDLLEKLARREDLTADEASAAMGEIMDGRASEPAMAGLLMGLAMKGERPRRSSAWRGRCASARCRCRSRTPTSSTCAARAATAPARSTSRRSPRSSSRRAARAWRSTATGRCRAGAAARTCSRRSASPRPRRRRSWSGCSTRRAWRSSSRRCSTRRCGTRRPVRRALGLRTAFNLLGPLTNPARPRRQVVGVPRPELTELIARSLLLLGSERAWVVHGADGLDEISTVGLHEGVRVPRRDGEHVLRAPGRLRPAARAGGGARRAATRPANAAIARAVLDGRARRAARRRAAERGRGAAGRRRRADGGGRDRDGRRGDRQRAARPRCWTRMVALSREAPA